MTESLPNENFLNFFLLKKMSEPLHDLETNNINTRIVNEVNKKIGAFLAREAGFTSITSSANEVFANVLETCKSKILFILVLFECQLIELNSPKL